MKSNQSDKTVTYHLSIPSEIDASLCPFLLFLYYIVRNSFLNTVSDFFTYAWSRPLRQMFGERFSIPHSRFQSSMYRVGNPITIMKILTLVLGIYDEVVVHGELNGRLFRMALPKLRYTVYSNTVQFLRLI